MQSSIHTPHIGQSSAAANCSQAEGWPVKTNVSAPHGVPAGAPSIAEAAEVPLMRLMRREVLAAVAAGTKNTCCQVEPAVTA